MAAAALSLSASVLLVVRLERVGARLGLSEALLGLLAALAADTPEITSAVTAVLRPERATPPGSGKPATGRRGSPHRDPLTQPLRFQPVSVARRPGPRKETPATGPPETPTM